MYLRYSHKSKRKRHTAIYASHFFHIGTQTHSLRESIAYFPKAVDSFCANVRSPISTAIRYAAGASADPLSEKRSVASGYFQT